MRTSNRIVSLAMSASVVRALILLVALFCPGLALAPQTQTGQQRALRLNHFPFSRQTQADASGFYSMPTAIGEDYFDGTSPLARVRRHLAVARRAGVKFLRCGFSWNAIEKEPGRYDWKFWDALVALAAQKGIELTPYVAYPPKWAVRDAKDFWKQPPRDPALYADFMQKAVTRYRGRIRTWEIWNEPDNKDYWTSSAEEFARLVKTTAPRIREADPNAVIVLGGMAYGPGEFFRELMTRHHISRYVDVIALHGYPESWLEARAETVFHDWIPAMQQMIVADGSGADLWLNEMGYADYRFRANQASLYGTSVLYRHEHTREYQAAMLFKFEVMALASQGVSLTGWYRIDDFPRSEKRLGRDLVNYHLGVVDDRQRPKPAFFALRSFNRLFGRPTRRVTLNVARGPKSQSVVEALQRKDGSFVVVGWLRSSLPQELAINTGNLPDRRSENVSIQAPCAAARTVGFYDALGRRLKLAARMRAGRMENITLHGDRVLVAELSCGINSNAPRQPHLRGARGTAGSSD